MQGRTNHLLDADREPISQTGDFDVYDIRQPADVPFPPKTYIAYLQDDAVRRAIGARVRYQQCSMNVASQFRLTGDSKYSFSSLS